MQHVLSPHNLESLKEFNDFLYDIRYILVFYVLGDFITTAKALNYGVEANGFMALVMAEFGVWTLFALKLVFVLIVYWIYKGAFSSSEKQKTDLWPMMKNLIVFVGIFLVINNLLVIWGSFSPLQLLGIASL
ncbi:DUF5658 family protein [Methanococcoides burtonii]|uniref:DUF5658 domain-containing protein n=1 Tax=Methanococcoides burtonii (strain DSM 6242 / NBRC 107633 / OCM 468 / ACE-M) TaxID=259564 RepID=Q12VK4_METBU|nr:DUF5658 family protein [Methanococcoides burtonii]ABE52522.1 Hypothetical protein Mbur_1618 [Methanococcoides burtonii DSM 6242]